LESWGFALGDEGVDQSNRVDSKHHFFSAEEVNGDTNGGIWIKTLGRYFKIKDGFSEPGSRGHSHQLTQVILDAKNSHHYPEWLVACCAHYVAQLAKRCYAAGSKKMIICPIPARPNTNNRLEHLVDMIAKSLPQERNIVFDNKLLGFKAGVHSNKELNRLDRITNIRDHLTVNDSELVKGSVVLILDDVCTTGATLYFGNRYLRQAGAFDVHCASLTSSIP
jgi:hypothetical protein